MSALASLVAAVPTHTGSGGGGSKSPIIAVIAGAFVLVISGLQAVNPRLLWRANRWQYKNPDANEPSEKAFLVQRIIGGVIAIAAVVFIIVGLTKL